MTRCARWALLCTALTLLVAAPVARAEVGPLRVDPMWNGPLTSAAAVVALALALPALAPRRCQFCGSGGELDEDLRERLVWRNPSPARRASDVIANGVLPAAVLLNSAVFSWTAGEPSAFWVDALVLAEVAALGADLNGISKDAIARRRPGASEPSTGAGNRSFYSGHTSLAFSLAAGAGTVSTLRGYPSAPWVWAGGMTFATGVAYLRVAGDAHWTTDVLAGAAVGGLIGFAVPWFFHRVPRRDLRKLDIVPRPGGVAVVF